ERFRDAAAGAIESLIAASGESVSHLADGMMRVQEIADQTQVIANRATLIALHALTAGASGETREVRDALPQELKALAADVRTAHDRVAALTAEIERDVAAARERMNGVRATVATALERESGPLEAASEPGSTIDAVRLMERVREMIQDATSKGERLSSAGERASRAAERLKRQIETQAGTIAEMAAALEGKPAPPAATEAAAAPAPGGARLRVLGRDDASAVPPRPREREERA
ncbi:MAG: hypothetical protein HYR73_04235, partial [Candidatus Eisenbacteria bacterium]|nr:hypothetical protein [Candidatus Eisenbacteria bacterium]